MSVTAVGIDLGTTYTVLSAINPAGKPEIIANRDGDRITASAVLFQADGTTVVGQHAAESAELEPERVVRWVKRHIGDPSWKFTLDGVDHTAVDLSAMILASVRDQAADVIGAFVQAVITVPAYFDEFRRKATMDAAAKAGIDVLRIINEPTAAALAYTTTGTVEGNVLVYDLGGGTFDVSIVRVDSPTQMTVIASEGDHQLGGVDFDRRLAIYFDELFKAEHSVSLLDGSDESAMQHTLVEAEKAKKKLTTVATANGVLLRRGDAVLMTSVDRATFTTRTADLLVRTEMLLDEALDAAALRSEDISNVILVGGSSRMPQVHDMLRKKFNREPLRHINPDEAVALGAAVQAGLILHEKGSYRNEATSATYLAHTKVTDVTNHSYGAIVIETEFTGARKRNSIMIRKNTPIPCSRTQTFYTLAPNQTIVSCQITQGEDEDPSFVNVIAEGELELPSGRPSGCEIRVTYRYDANGRMSCTYLDVLTGISKDFDLDHSSRG